MRNGPPHHPTLVGTSELAGTGEHAKAVYDDRQIIGLRIFLARGIGNELAKSIDTALAATDRKFFRNSMDGMKPRGVARQGDDSRRRDRTQSASEFRGAEERSGDPHRTHGWNSRKSEEFSACERTRECEWRLFRYC